MFMPAAPARPPVDPLSLTPGELRAALVDHFRERDQPEYRVGQVERWFYRNRVRSIGEMSDLPLAERDALERSFPIAEPTVETVVESEDGTVKHLWRLHSGHVVESVLIPAAGRLTLCVSSQAGCALACRFCATGWGGFDGQLTAGEIAAQYRASLRWALENELGRITNVVYMGMGEPLANRKAVFSSLAILNRGYGLGARRITVSTVGVVPGILELARRPEQFGLALSLHAPHSELRAELVPLEKRYPLGEVIRALKEFRRSGGRRITFEYTMIRGINDDLSLVPALAGLATEVGAFVNLIPFNPIPYQDWQPSSRLRLSAFADELAAAGIPVAVRETRGRDIDAACGQLRAHAFGKGALRNGGAPELPPDQRRRAGVRR